MTEESETSLEAALDGLQAAERYCFDRGLDDLGHDVAELYQAVAKQSPIEDWDVSIEALYDRADDPEAFHAALAEGDIERAAGYRSLSEDELHAHLDRLYTTGVSLAAGETAGALATPLKNLAGMLSEEGADRGMSDEDHE